MSCADTVDSVDGSSGGGHVRVMHVQHTQGPIDGSLYATVNKKSPAPASQHVSIQGGDRERESERGDIELRREIERDRETEHSRDKRIAC